MAQESANPLTKTVSIPPVLLGRADRGDRVTRRRATSSREQGGRTTFSCAHVLFAVLAMKLSLQAFRQKRRPQ